MFFRRLSVRDVSAWPSLPNIKILLLRLHLDRYCQRYIYALYRKRLRFSVFICASLSAVRYVNFVSPTIVRVFCTLCIVSAFQELIVRSCEKFILLGLIGYKNSGAVSFLCWLRIPFWPVSFGRDKIRFVSLAPYVAHSDSENQVVPNIKNRFQFSFSRPVNPGPIDTLGFLLSPEPIGSDACYWLCRQVCTWHPYFHSHLNADISFNELHIGSGSYISIIPCRIF